MDCLVLCIENGLSGGSQMGEVEELDQWLATKNHIQIHITSRPPSMHSFKPAKSSLSLSVFLSSSLSPVGSLVYLCICTSFLSPIPLFSLPPLAPLPLTFHLFFSILLSSSSPFPHFSFCPLSSCVYPCVSLRADLHILRIRCFYQTDSVITSVQK